jgi:triacylglycerol lipase
VMSRYDELVIPYTSGYLEGEDNFVLQDLCPLNHSEHLAMAFDPVAAQLTFNALDPGRARPVDC